MTAFLISFVASAVLLCLLLASDRRVFELRKARAEVIELDKQIATFQAENAELQAAAEAARRHDFPGREGGPRGAEPRRPRRHRPPLSSGRPHDEEDPSRAPGQALNDLR